MTLPPPKLRFDIGSTHQYIHRGSCWVHGARGGSDYHHEYRWVEWCPLAEALGDMKASVETYASVR